MAEDPARRARGLRALLTRDHERLEALFVQLLDECREGDWDELRKMWSRFDTDLLAHLAVEERYLLPLFERVEPIEAGALLAEHVVFRRTLDELGVGVDLHAVRLDVAQGFIEALRAHAKREDQLFYRWAEREVGELGQEAVVRDLGTPTKARRP
jgi:hemerythrin-like domain-containing protein